MDVACLNFRAEIFTGGCNCKIAKFVKVFSLKSFLLYGVYIVHVHVYNLHAHIRLHTRYYFDEIISAAWSEDS